MIFLPVFLQCGGEAVSLPVEKWEFKPQMTQIKRDEHRCICHPEHSRGVSHKVFSYVL